MRSYILISSILQQWNTKVGTVQAILGYIVCKEFKSSNKTTQKSICFLSSLCTYNDKMLLFASFSPCTPGYLAKYRDRYYTVVIMNI